MAACLIDAGHQVTVWNRTRSKAEALPRSAAIADTPAEAARGVEAVITMLATPDALSEVLFGDQGVTAGTEPGTMLIDMSTVGPDHVQEVAARLPDGVELIDAPVLGGVANAVDGTLKIYVGGSEAAFARCRELLAPLGTPVHLGPTGAGASMKLVANATLAGLILDAAERRGVRLELILDTARWLEQADQHGLGGDDYSAVVAEIRGRTATG
jgi:3-hydroxyisobutyrate dehydrogenase-like beta-hydroxyacid dehydrogenase